MMSDSCAVYLPAVSEMYASGVIRPMPQDRPFPSGVDLSDLIFWNKRSCLWSHRQVLHSVGAYSVGSTADNAITRMGRDDYLLLGDSSGFQIGKGSLKGFDALRPDMAAQDAIAAWRDAYVVRDWIVGWLETYAHYAMTLDMPLWATLGANAGTPFHHCTPKQLTDLTVANLQFIDKHRRGRTKWLNVLQGLDEQTTRDWWNAVKWFPCSGYALAGYAGARGGIRAVLQTLLMMRDDRAFDGEQNWLHVLGVASPQWAILLTAIQRALRKYVNPDMRVSFDAATPFQAGGQREEVAIAPRFRRHPDDWTFRFERAPQGKEFVGSDEPFGYDSPIGRLLTRGHLNVVADEWQSRKYDTVSVLLLINHNVWTYLAAFEDANRLAFDTDREDVPPTWRNCLDLIDGAFTSSRWPAYLDENRSLLDAVAPCAYR